jgi:hypothetical protein
MGDARRYFIEKQAVMWVEQLPKKLWRDRLASAAQPTLLMDKT